MKAFLVTISLIFLALSIVRTSFPASYAQIKEKLEPVSRYGETIASEAIAMGKKMSGRADAVYVWETKSKDPPAEEEPSTEPTDSITPSGEFKIDNMVTSNLSGFPGGLSVFIPPETEDALALATPPESEPEPESDPEAEAAALATAAINALQIRIDDFLAEQTAATGLPVPDSICTEAVLLDVEYAAPSAVAFTSVFGYRLHPIYNDIRFHYGTDFQAYTGDAITAFAAGNVIAAQEFEGYGLTVILDHGNGLTSLYAHCSVLNVSFGDWVELGQAIALVGQTGNVTGPHLHFELQKDGKYLNPEFYL